MLLVGAGSVARAKHSALSPTGCSLRVVALRISGEFRREVEEKGGETHERPFRPSDLHGVSLVIAATNDPNTNQFIAKTARGLGVWVNAVDDPASCDVYFAATVRRGPLTLAIGSAGGFPGLTRALRRLVEAFIPEGDGPLLQRLARARQRCRALPDSGARKAALDPLLTAFEATYPGVPHELEP